MWPHQWFGVSAKQIREEWLLWQLGKSRTYFHTSLHCRMLSRPCCASSMLVTCCIITFLSFILRLVVYSPQNLSLLLLHTTLLFPLLQIYWLRALLPTSSVIAHTCKPASQAYSSFSPPAPPPPVGISSFTASLPATLPFPLLVNANS